MIDGVECERCEAMMEKEGLWAEKMVDPDEGSLGWGVYVAGRRARSLDGAQRPAGSHRRHQQRAFQEGRCR